MRQVKQIRGIMSGLIESKIFHAVIRWGLGIHGSIHLVEFILNLFEGAILSAFFTLISASLMLGGALIDASHHNTQTH